MKITAIKIHHVQWERGPYHWRDGIMPYHTPSGIVDASTEIDSEGYAGSWDLPGLGIQVDWDWASKHTVGVEE